MHRSEPGQEQAASGEVDEDLVLTEIVCSNDGVLHAGEDELGGEGMATEGDDLSAGSTGNDRGSVGGVECRC